MMKCDKRLKCKREMVVIEERESVGKEIEECWV